MASLVSRISDLTSAVGAKIKDLYSRVPPAGGTTGQVLSKTSATNYAMSWTTPIDTPAGSDTQIQYNNAGVVAGDVDLTWSNTTNSLGLNGADTGINFLGITNEPAATASNIMRLYAKNTAGRMIPKWTDPSGFDTAVAAAVWGNNGSLISPLASTAIQATGCAITTMGTVSTPTLTTGSIRNQMRRFSMATATAVGSLAGVRVNALECWRGNGTNQGGFFVCARFGLTGTTQSGMRAFVGISDTAPTAPTNVDPTTNTTPGKIGMAINMNSGNWMLVSNITGTAPTRIDLGTNYTVNMNDHLELILYAAPNASVVGYRVTNFTSNIQTTGSLSTNIPAATTFLGRTAWISNNSVAASLLLEMSRFYLETDF